MIANVLLDLDGTLYRQGPVRRAMAGRLRFRHQHGAGAGLGQERRVLGVGQEADVAWLGFGQAGDAGDGSAAIAAHRAAEQFGDLRHRDA